MEVQSPAVPCGTHLASRPSRGPRVFLQAMRGSAGFAGIHTPVTAPEATSPGPLLLPGTVVAPSQGYHEWVGHARFRKGLVGSVTSSPQISMARNIQSVLLTHPGHCGEGENVANRARAPTPVTLHISVALASPVAVPDVGGGGGKYDCSLGIRTSHCYNKTRFVQRSAPCPAHGRAQSMGPVMGRAWGL